MPDHHCHLDICRQRVPPAKLFCLPHWRMTPRVIQREIWDNYRPGQEVDKRPTRAYLDAQRRARVAVLEKIAAGGCTDPLGICSDPSGTDGLRCNACAATVALARLQETMRDPTTSPPGPRPSGV